MKNKMRKVVAGFSCGALLTVAFSGIVAAPAHASSFGKQQLSALPAQPAGQYVYAPAQSDYVAAAKAMLQQVAKSTAKKQPVVAPSSNVNPKAPVPNPLDFGSQAADPNTYLMPNAADKFKNGSNYEIPRPTAVTAGAGAIVPGLEDFYKQQIAWESCEGYHPSDNFGYVGANTQCGYLLVPVDYSDPQGPAIAIGLLKVPAQDQAGKIGTVFVDPGGPGGSGMEFATYTVGAAGPLREKFDIIGFDPRGVSSSLPMIRCKSSAAFDAQRQGSDKLTAAEQDQVLKHNTEECYNNTAKGFKNLTGEKFINNVGTVNVVKDLDIARSAVGDKKINYLGYSYGTSIGYHYALQFPDNIRTMVLDGVVNPLENNPDEAKKYEKYTEKVTKNVPDDLVQIQGFQATFEKFLEHCGNGGFAPAECAVGTGTDIAVLQAKYQEIARKAWGGTAYETNESPARPLSFADMTTGTIMAMYAQSLWPELNMALLTLRDNNDATGIMGLADQYYNRDGNGNYTFSDSAFQTIWCTDSGKSDAHDDAKAIAALKKQYEVAPFTDPGVDNAGKQRGLEPARDWCTYYKVKGQLPKGKTLEAMPNILYVSSTYDPSTPYQDGVVAAAATGATLLSVANNGHTAYWPGAANCTAQTVDAYFLTMLVPTTHTGAANVETKDLVSNVITGDQCRVDSFRAENKVADAQAAPGDTVTINASGLVRNTEYKLDLPAGYTGVTTTSAVDGTAVFTVTVPANAQPGAVIDFMLLPANAADNDPAVRAAAKLTLQAKAAPGGSNPGSGPGNPGVTAPVKPNTPPATSSAGNGNAGAGKALAKGGSQAPVALLTLAVLAAIGGGIAAVAKRKRANS